MSLRVDDRWLWLGLGVFTFFAVRGVSHALKDVLSLTEIKEEPRKQLCPVSQDTEDAIKAGSLRVLTKSHNLDIRNAAIKILCDRFLTSSTNITALTLDAFSPDPNTRTRATTALKLLERYASTPDTFAFISGLYLHNTEGLPPINQLPPHPTARLTQPPPQRRAHDESPEEQALRRRRREAIVLNEGDRPVSQGDIIQRVGTGESGTVVRPRDEMETRWVERRLEEVTAAGVWDGSDE